MILKVRFANEKSILIVEVDSILKFEMSTDAFRAPIETESNTEIECALWSKRRDDWDKDVLHIVQW